MALAVSDMDICRKMTPQFLASRLTLLKGAQLIVADANLPAESLRFLADHGAAPLFVDPVSTVKAEKLRPILGKIHTLKPNRMEAELLSGVAITNEESLRQAAQVLLDTGLRRVFISLGSRGLFAADHRESLLLPLPTGWHRSMPQAQGMRLWRGWHGHTWKGRTSGDGLGWSLSGSHCH